MEASTVDLIYRVQWPPARQVGRYEGREAAIGACEGRDRFDLAKPTS